MWSSGRHHGTERHVTRSARAGGRAGRARGSRVAARELRPLRIVREARARRVRADDHGAARPAARALRRARAFGRPAGRRAARDQLQGAGRWPRRAARAGRARAAAGRRCNHDADRLRGVGDRQRAARRAAGPADRARAAPVDRRFLPRIRCGRAGQAWPRAEPCGVERAASPACVPAARVADGRSEAAAAASRRRAERSRGQRGATARIGAAALVGVGRDHPVRCGAVVRGALDQRRLSRCVAGSVGCAPAARRSGRAMTATVPLRHMHVRAVQRRSFQDGARRRVAALRHHHRRSCADPRAARCGAPRPPRHDTAAVARRAGFTVHAGRLTIDEPNAGETAAAAAARW
ncbi:hypothetical protein BVI434_1450007 [Burkholderia vietnamiensis]|nr:hypothetical protein BVI434_1450007 [Burkholderia vietnamiensis]